MVISHAAARESAWLCRAEGLSGHAQADVLRVGAIPVSHGSHGQGVAGSRMSVLGVRFGCWSGVLSGAHRSAVGGTRLLSNQQQQKGLERRFTTQTTKC